MLERTLQPKRKPLDQFVLPEYLKLESNGLPLLVFPHQDKEIFKLDLLFDGGIRHQSLHYVAQITNSMLREGAGAMNSEAFSKQLDQLGAFVELSCDYFGSYISVYGLTHSADKLIPMVVQMCNQARMDADEFAQKISQYKNAYLVNLEKTEYIAQKAMQNLLFGDAHPLGKKHAISDFEELKPQEVKAFYEQKIQNKIKAVVLSGGDHAKLKDLIAGEITSGVVPVIQGNPPAEINSAKGKVLKLPLKNSMQSSIRIGIESVGKKHPDYLGLQILNMILGGYFGSRLMHNIREDKGFTYGISSRFTSLGERGYFTISTDVGNEFADQTIEEVKKEIIMLQTTLVQQNELEKVKNYMMGLIQRNTDGAYTLSDAARSLYFEGFDLGYYLHYVNKIKSIEAEEIKDLAVKYLPVDKMNYVICGS